MTYCLEEEWDLSVGFDLLIALHQWGERNAEQTALWQTGRQDSDYWSQIRTSVVTWRETHQGFSVCRFCVVWPRAPAGRRAPSCQSEPADEPSSCPAGKDPAPASLPAGTADRWPATDRERDREKKEGRIYYHYYCLAILRLRASANNWLLLCSCYGFFVCCYGV